ncbi:MAG: adenylyltransferase/cytidyltransferase family protein, partial [Bacteroidota bacterium]
MEIHRSFDINKKIKNPVVTTGSFDGVHIGHKTILQRLKKIANEIDGETVLITFYPHPRKVLYPETHGKNLKLISTQREKIFLLEQAGLDHLIIVNFTREFAKTTSHQFVEDILVGKLDARRIIVGFNHHFGHNREGDYEYLYELAKTHDFEVEEIPEQDVENETVSSTTIRQALSEGKIQRANAYLDHYYII